MTTIWEDVTIPKRDKLQGREVADCTVIGAGLAGIMIAAELERRGFGVVVLDADRVLSGATKGTSAKITAQHGLIYERLSRTLSPESARLYFDSNTQGIKKIERLVLERNIDCDFKKTSSYIYRLSDSTELIKEAHALAQLKIDAVFTKRTELPYGVCSALRFDSQAQFHPLKFAAALSKGLKIYENSPAVEIEDGRVKTPLGEVLTNYIVNTTHYPLINLPGMYFLRQHQERSYEIALKTDRKLDGMYLGLDDGMSLRSFDGGILVGGEKHRTGDNRKGGCYMRLIEFAKKHFPEAEVLAGWSNQDAITHDYLPFIGRYSTFSHGMFVATGFNKWGMTLSAVASEIIPDLISERENPYAQLYSPRRVNLRAAAPRLAEDVAYSVTGIFSGLVSGKERRCTHLGGKLYRNPDEGTWECPCHGSEFTEEGEVIFSPAKKGIKYRQKIRKTEKTK